MGDPRYEDIPYPGKPYACTHPLRLATVARLVGRDAPEVRTAKVLELGCGDGLNLIGMAVNLPDAWFVGVDGSPAAIAVGLEAINDLGLTNVHLVAGDIEAIDPNSDKFDYIIAHGVYSWVPTSVRRSVLRASGALLADQGVAYISYNTYPRWHLHQLVRSAMLAHVGHLTDPAKQLAEARALLKTLASAEGGGTHFSKTLALLASRLEDISDASLFHDYLAPINEPTTLVQFLEAAAEFDLHFVGEAEPWDLLDGLVPPALEPLVEAQPTTVARAQMTDALVGRGFRRTLLSHGEPCEAVRAEQLAALQIFLRAEPEQRITLEREGTATLHSMTGARVQVGDPMLRAALAELVEAAPDGLVVSDLLDRAEQAARAVGVSPTPRERVHQRLLEMFAAMAIELRVPPPYRYGRRSERPEGNPMARWQLAQGNEWVVNADHYSVSPPPLARVVLAHADGQRSVDELLEACVDAAQNGILEISDLDGPVTDPDRLRARLRGQVDTALEFLEEAMLLRTVPL